MDHDTAPVSRPTGENGHGGRRVSAADVMTAPVVVVSRTESVLDAWARLGRTDLHHLVVVDGSRCVGVVDDRRLSAEWGPTHGGATTTVGELLGHAPRCILPGTSLRDAAQAMLDEGVDAMPVVRDNGDVLGLITARDVLRHVATS